MKKIRIAYILSSTTAYGGATKAFRSFLQQLLPKGIEPLLVLPDREGIYEEFKAMGVPVFVSTYRAATFPYLRTRKDYLMFLPRTIARLIVNHRAAKRLTCWLRDKHIDIIHTNVGVIDIGFKASRRLNIPHIYHIREYADKDFGMHYFPTKRRFYRQLTDQGSYSICITRDIQDYHHQADKSTSRVIYDGVMPRRTTEVLPVSKREPFLLYAGRVEPTKGLDLLLEAYKKYKETSEETLPLYVAGSVSSKPFYEQVLQYVKDNGLTDDIHFIGEVPDIESYMQRARTLIIPSRSEGFGLCMPEAMFNGCLCIGHDTGGTHEQLENGLRLEGAEIALRYDNTEELSRLLCEITDRKPEYYDTMTQRAFHAVNTLYSSEINGDNIYKFYQDIL